MTNGQGRREGEEEVANGDVIVAIHKRVFQDVHRLLVAGEFSSSFSKPLCRGRNGGRAGGNGSAHFNMSRR